LLFSKLDSQCIPGSCWQIRQFELVVFQMLQFELPKDVCKDLFRSLEMIQNVGCDRFSGLLKQLFRHGVQEVQPLMGLKSLAVRAGIKSDAPALGAHLHQLGARILIGYCSLQQFRISFKIALHFRFGSEQPFHPLFERFRNLGIKFLPNLCPWQLCQVDGFHRPVIPEALLKCQQDPADGGQHYACPQSILERGFHAHGVFHEAALLGWRHSHRGLYDRPDLG